MSIIIIPVWQKSTIITNCKSFLAIIINCKSFLAIIGSKAELPTSTAARFQKWALCLTAYCDNYV